MHQFVPNFLIYILAKYYMNWFIIIIIILFVHENNFIKTWQPTTRERDRQG